MRLEPAAGVGLGAILGLAALALMLRPATRPRAASSGLPVRAPIPDPRAAVHAARRMNRAAGVIAASVLADSAVEHYRGSFHNKAMVAPLVTATLSLAASVHGNADKQPAAHRLRDGVYAAAALTGLRGTGFHLYNISQKPGGFSWQNLFYSAPIGAPAALILSGALGFLAERVRENGPGVNRRPSAACSAGRVVAAVTSSAARARSARPACCISAAPTTIRSCTCR